MITLSLITITLEPTQCDYASFTVTPIMNDLIDIFVYCKVQTVCHLYCIWLVLYSAYNRFLLPCVCFYKISKIVSGKFEIWLKFIFRQSVKFSHLLDRVCRRWKDKTWAVRKIWSKIVRNIVIQLCIHRLMVSCYISRTLYAMASLHF